MKYCYCEGEYVDSYKCDNATVPCPTAVRALHRTGNMIRDKSEMKDKETVSPKPDAMEKKKVRVVFGLEQQGHIPTIEKMLTDFGFNNQYAWEKIAEKIGWEWRAVVFHYVDHLRESRIAELEKENKELNDEVRFLNTAEDEWFHTCADYQKENDDLIEETNKLESRLSAANEFLERSGHNIKF